MRVSTRKYEVAKRVVIGLWLVAITVLAVSAAYTLVIDPPMILALTAPLAIVLILAIVATVPPVAIVGAMRSVWHGHYRSAMASLALLLFGAAWFFGSLELSSVIWRDRQLAGYRQQIEQARQAGRNVERQDVAISLGPPTMARFQQPGLMWSGIAFVGYDESDGMAEATKLNTACNERSRSLGHHFFLIDSDC